MTSEDDRPFAGAVALGGLLAGSCLGIATILVSRWGISANGWLLSGNRALIIPFGLGPAVVAGGWSAVILRLRGHPLWAQLGFVSGLIGLALAAASLVSLIVLGPRNRGAGGTASLLFGFLLYGWLLAGAIAAAMIPAPDPRRKGPPIWSIAALLLLPVTLIGGCEAGSWLLAT